jgi:hypothetical protein
MSETLLALKRIGNKRSFQVSIFFDAEKFCSLDWVLALREVSFFKDNQIQTRNIHISYSYKTKCSQKKRFEAVLLCFFPLTKTIEIVMNESHLIKRKKGEA